MRKGFAFQKSKIDVQKLVHILKGACILGCWQIASLLNAKGFANSGPQKRYALLQLVAEIFGLQTS